MLDGTEEKNKAEEEKEEEWQRPKTAILYRVSEKRTLKGVRELSSNYLEQHSSQRE